MPIVCVGERLDEREGNRTEEVLAEQFDGGLAPLTPDQFAKLVIAYEPVWAIGTGKTATPQMAADAHRFIRGKVAGSSVTDCIRSPNPLWRKRETGQREKPDGRRRDRRRTGRRRKPRPEVIRLNRQILRIRRGICYVDLHTRAAR